MSYHAWRPYVPVARRRRQAARQMDKLRKKGADILPVEIEGRRIAATFWGQAWCRHLESFSDFANRLPRGRTYVRNGSVCHLEIARGRVKAIVSGSELYDVAVKITPLATRKWRRMKQRCAGQIGSLLELLAGKLSDSVMEVVTDRTDGLFPRPKEISLNCNCPDWATMCKHVAAVLYGVGARLDERPELLFLLRGVDHEELISAEAEAAAGSVIRRGGTGRRIAERDLPDVFGIDIVPDQPPTAAPAKGPSKKTSAPKTGRKAPAAKAATKAKAAKKPVKKKRPAAVAQRPRKPRKKAPARTTAEGPRKPAGKTGRGSR